MEAALRAGVERVVYTSSVATLALRSDGSPSNETMPLAEAQGIGTYKRSKIAAERLVEAMVRERGLPAVIVNPSTPVGARDVKPTPTGRIIVETANGRMPAFIETGLNLVHVDDVAAGHLAALQTRQGRRALHSRRGECPVLKNAGGYRGPCRSPGAAAAAALARADPGRACRRSGSPHLRTRAVCDAGRGAHGEIPDVL